MRIFASAAITADGALDDCTSQRLRISDDADWSAVAQLRAHHDAILVGAQTVRCDNPKLLITNQALRIQRTARGMNPDMIKVTITESGQLDPRSNFFSQGAGAKIVFSTRPLPELEHVAQIVVVARITASRIVTELEKRGINSLFIEGGSQTLRMFFAEGLIDTFRLAVNAQMQIDDPKAPRLDIDPFLLDIPHTTESVGALNVSTYTIHSDQSQTDIHYLKMAIEASRHCTPSTTSYCVGAIIVTNSGEVFTGYTHETSPTHHAEQEAVIKALAAGVNLRGATIYSSMEPCSTRKSEPESCSAMILRLGFSCVVFALYEPDCFVDCQGAINLREGGVEVRVVPDMAPMVLKVNAHLKG